MKQALLIIDVQAGLFDPLPHPFEADSVVQKINGLSAYARTNNIPIIHIQHEVSSGDVLRHGSDSWQLQKDITVNSGDTRIRKTTPDSFLRTDLLDILQTNKITDLIICGYASEFCVDTTTRSAAAHGFNVQLVADAHTTHDKPHASATMIREHHNQTLPNITSFGQKIIAIPAHSLWMSRCGITEQ